MKLFALVLISFVGTQASAWIMPTRTWISKATETQVATPQWIENRVKFSHGDQSLELKEKWLLESDQSQILIVTPAEGNIGWKLVIKTSGQQRQLKMPQADKDITQKLEDISLERYFISGKNESLSSLFLKSRFIPKEALAKKELPKTSKEVIPESESWAKLSRAGGVPCVLFAENLNSENATQAIWLDQDRFAVRKIQQVNGLKMTVEDFSDIGKGKLFPSLRQIEIGNTQVEVKMISINPADTKSKAYGLIKNETTQLNAAFDALTIKDALFDFYMRSR